MDKYKEIVLTRGKVARVDAEDFAWLNAFHWHYQSTGYASGWVIEGGVRRKMLMHRLILGAPKGAISDHINGDRLDNRRCNLRLTDFRGNNLNKAVNSRSQSIYKGLTKLSNGLWRVTVNTGEKDLYIGQFDDEKVAAFVYNQHAKKYHGVYARLNDVPDVAGSVVAKHWRTYKRAWIVTSPAGVVYEVASLSQFCREHGLNQGNLAMVARGSRHHSQGWIARYADAS